MKRKYLAIAAASLMGLLVLYGCGSSGGSEAGGQAASEGTSSSAEQVAASVSETSSADAGQEAPDQAPSSAGAASENSGASSSAEASPADSTGPYAWLGLQEMPQCNYVDIMSTAHYIQTYDYYVMGMSTEQTEAIDVINSYTADANSRVYSVDGKVVSVNENSKIYIEQDMGGVVDTAKARMEDAMKNGTNIYGRSFVGTGSEAIPLYSDAGDTTEYEYYEFNYPEAEAYGTTMLERYYLKDGDVFAIYSKTGSDDSAVEATKVIKSISGTIPEGTFVVPDLEAEGYTKYEE